MVFPAFFLMACLRSDSDGSDHFCGQRFKSSHFQPERDRGAVWRIDALGALTYVAASFGKSVLRRRSSKSGRIRRRLTVIGTPQQGQRNFGRGLTSASGLRGFTRSTICSKAIRPFLFARVPQPLPEICRFLRNCAMETLACISTTFSASPSPSRKPRL